MTDSNTFYTPVWEYNGFKLVSRPDSPNLHIAWTPSHSGRYRRKSTGTADLAEAQKMLVAFANTRSRPTANDPDEVELMPLVHAYAGSGSPGRCHAATVRHLGDFCNAYGVRTVADMHLDLQDEYIDWRRAMLIDGGYKGTNSTIARDLAVLRGAINDAWKRKRLSSAPYVRSLSPSPPRSRFLTQDESRRLITECHEPHLRLFVMCGLHTLQRPSAIFQLTVDRVDLGRGVIDFLPQGQAQSHKRRPVVPITATLRPLLAQAIEDSVSGFIVEYQGTPVKSVRTTFNKARDRAGLGDDVSPYTLRHTGATHLAGMGVPLRQIAGMMGHTVERTTELYAKHSPEFLKDARDSLDRVFSMS